jgi:hypothetical protein
LFSFVAKVLFLFFFTFKPLSLGKRERASVMTAQAFALRVALVGVVL